jgi:hypothetical protein
VIYLNIKGLNLNTKEEITMKNSSNTEREGKGKKKKFHMKNFFKVFEIAVSEV